MREKMQMKAFQPKKIPPPKNKHETEDQNPTLQTTSHLFKNTFGNVFKACKQTKTPGIRNPEQKWIKKHQERK